MSEERKEPAYYAPEWTEGCDWCEDYEMLVGPDGFTCYLTEPEDRCWYRDLSGVIDKLNTQHNRIEELESTTIPRAWWKELKGVLRVNILRYTSANDAECDATAATCEEVLEKMQKIESREGK